MLYNSWQISISKVRNVIIKSQLGKKNSEKMILDNWLKALWQSNANTN